MASGIFYPAAPGDDGRIRGDDFSFSSSEQIIYFGSYWNHFIRFINITIPQGAIINSAFVRVYAGSDQDTGLNRQLVFCDEDDAAAITSYGDWAARPVTGTISWTPSVTPPYWVAVTGEANDTPDLTAILQVIIDRSGWASGQAIQLLADGPNGGQDGGLVQICHIDYFAGAYKAELHVDWTPAATPVDLDFASSPLSLAISGSAEILLLDFRAAPLEFVGSLKFADEDVDFAATPFESTGALFLSEFLSIDMAGAPLVLVGSFDPNFEGRGTNRVFGNWPAFIVSGKIETRSAWAEGTFPSFSLTANVLAGEIIQVEGSWPSFDVNGTGHTNEIAHVSGYFPRFKVKGKIISGDLAAVSGSFPRFIIAATGFQTPLIAIAGTFPAFRIHAFAVERAQILNRQYRTTVLNLKNMAVTKYEDFNFNSLCFFNGVYLGANDNGIYILGGDKDAGTDIDWYFKTPKIDFLNAIPRDIWLSLRNNQALAVNVEQNEDVAHPYTYPVNANPDPKIHMERVKLGRGLDARVMQMTVSGTGPIDLNQIAVVTDPVKKSKR